MDTVPVEDLCRGLPRPGGSEYKRENIIHHSLILEHVHELELAVNLFFLSFFSEHLYFPTIQLSARPVVSRIHPSSRLLSPQFLSVDLYQAFGSVHPSAPPRGRFMRILLTRALQ